MAEKVRVRFAPSPTGPLHIGGVRTALFNYLFARQNNGTFILRIEDTDQARFVAGAEHYIIESLNWCGIRIDEGVSKGGPFIPYRQSERKHIYKEHVDLLIAAKQAYYAFDTPAELENLRKESEAAKHPFSYDHTIRSDKYKVKNSLTLREQETAGIINSGVPYVIRFKIPEKRDILVHDIVRGNMVFSSSTLDDKVIFKSDGLPTYHLANVVDDCLMKITHVIRGEEWLPSLPLHILLYEAFGWKKPEFAHLPLILKPNGQGKLSKRDGDKDGFPVIPLEWISPEGVISSGYMESGYLPEAVVNMLALLGWNPGTVQELFTMDELIGSFSLDKVQKAGARFDPEKAKWFNQQYIKNLSNEELAETFIPELVKRNIAYDYNKVLKITGLVKERITFITEIWDHVFYFFQTPESYDKKGIDKFWKEDTAALIREALNIIESAPAFDSLTLEQRIKEFSEVKNTGFGKIMNPLRLILVGRAAGPHLFDIMELLGRDETIKRVNKGLETLSGKQQ